MSLAEDLLNSLPEDQPAVTSADPVTEPHIVINADKTVAIPEALQRILVQHDHNIETVTFDCPRYWDDHDLSQMGLRIVFQRSDGHKEPHPVENLRVDESDDRMIHFDWTISGNTTFTSGNVKITVCAKLTNAEGVSEREWHTIPNQDLFVNEGMDCSGEEIIERNPDILEGILVQLDELKNTGGVSDEQVGNAVAAYLEEHPIDPGVDEQEVRDIVDVYLAENPPTSNPDSGQNPSQGGGLSAAAAGLLITILQDCVTYHGQTANIDALKVLLTAGSAAPPEQGVTESGSVLTIISGVTIEENGDTLIIK